VALCAPSSPAGADEISPAQVGNLLRQLAAEFSFIVVDTPPGLGEHALSALECATDLVTITSMDVSSARGMRKEFEVLRELELLPASRQTVLNLADKWSGMSVGDVEAIIGAPVDVVLPRTRAVALATNRGRPVLLDAPRDPAARALRLVAERFTGGLTRKNWRDARRKEMVP
jgi:pilus assembly protein CpaE